MRGDLLVTLVGRVTKDPEAERKLVQAKLDRLQAELTKAEGELAERINGHDEGIAEAEAKADKALLALQRAERDSRVAQNEYQNILLDIEARKMSAERVQGIVLVKAEETKSATEAHAEAAQGVYEARSQSARILAASAGLRHRIERLKDRIALHRQKHSDVLA